MTSSDIDKSQIRYARLAGFMFLFVDAADMLGFYLVSGFQVTGNFVEAVHKIMESEMLYRFGLSSLLIGGVCTVFLAMGLYGAVKPIDHNLALVALLFRVVEVTIGGVVVLLSFASLKLYVDPDYIKAFDVNQLSALINLHSAMFSGVFSIAALFFSIGSILFFYLFFKSNYIPKFLSVFGLVGSALVPMVCFASLLSPRPPRILLLGWLPIGLAEILVGFWLLIRGLNDGRRTSVSQATVNKSETGT